MPTSRKILFENAGYYLAGLIILVFVGFWKTYFSRLFVEDFDFYFHFHSVTAFLWILMIIFQPILIKNRKFSLHKKVGKLSYLLIPLVFVSVILLAHSRQSIDDESLGISLLVPFKDLLVLGVAYFIAISYRKVLPIHARAMIACGLVFVEPSLFRVIRNYVPVEKPYFLMIGLVYALLIVLTLVSWKHKRGRWVFPLILGMYVVVHSILVFRLEIGILDRFARWFVQLPLT